MSSSNEASATVPSAQIELVNTVSGVATPSTNIGDAGTPAASQTAAVGPAAVKPASTDAPSSGSRDAEIRRLAMTLISFIDHDVKDFDDNSGVSSKNKAEGLWECIWGYHRSAQPLRNLILTVEPDLKRIDKEVDDGCSYCHADDDSSSESS
ncbi:hypothetical protein PSEUBRA_004885 [Kalmanozyma brasiliensis GHG001]|uniref:uncharacterized protein n=1 Tax=Kalmanozyma brasiliensis (strain GHG001) TaxID=1365824 RepID=UPI002867C1E5|nr:uncharacterized protein PSEUBRA_004885 [Kalmanozyma brasiliensis GHG001]KAF6767450.1 hypothetical protein PSEUBRA_004885 [Kalmanozyma brasiliensis GHG001]